MSTYRQGLGKKKKFNNNTEDVIKMKNYLST